MKTTSEIKKKMDDLLKKVKDSSRSNAERKKYYSDYLKLSAQYLKMKSLLNDTNMNGMKKKNTTLLKIIAEAKRITKAHPHMEWKNAIKDASKHIKEGAKTVITKSKKGIRALPVNFVGQFAGFKFKIVNQYRIDGGVTAQIVEFDAPGSLIGELTGMKHEIEIVTNALYSQSLSFGLSHGLEYELSDDRDKKKLRDQVKKFITLLHDDVLKFNKGTDTKITVSKGVHDLSKSKPKKQREFKPREVTKKAGVVAQIKSILKANHKILKGGYTIKPGKIRDISIDGIGNLHHELIEEIKRATNGIHECDRFILALKGQLKTSHNKSSIKTMIKRYQDNKKHYKSILSSAKRQLK